VELPVKARVYVYCLGLIALSALAYYARLFSFASIDQAIAFFLFIILGFLSEVYATWIPVYGSELSSSIAIYLGSLLILGPALSVFVVLVATLGSETVMRWSYLGSSRSRFVHALLFNVSQFVVAVGVTGLVLALGHRSPLGLTSAGDYLWALASFVSCSLINATLVMGIVAITEKKGFWHVLRTYLRDFILQYLVLSVLALLLTVLYSISIWHMFLALVPLVLVHVSFRSYLRLQTETRKTFERISRLLDERDHYTAVHSTAVAELAVKIALDMKLPETEIEKVEIAAKVHDIGKVAVPDAILLKPGSLSPDEWAVMKRHPVVSAELIEGLGLYTPVAEAVRREHERWDGRGYPGGLKGEEIPRIARVIAAADIYNALVTDRPYRKAFPPAKAKKMIEELSGTDLDPAVAAALLRVLESE
jgi:hypothetical protein